MRVPQHWLTGVQIYRALGVIFLILYGTGKLPGVFAWPAGLGDVLVGVLAPVVAVAYARDPHQNADLVSAWNLFGLADLVIAVTAGMLTSPSPLQLFAFDLPNELVSQFPLVFVPGIPRAGLGAPASGVAEETPPGCLARQQPSRNLTRSGVMQARSMSKRSWPSRRGRFAGRRRLKRTSLELARVKTPVTLNTNATHASEWTVPLPALPCHFRHVTKFVEHAAAMARRMSAIRSW